MLLLVFLVKYFVEALLSRDDLVSGALAKSGFKGLDTKPDQESRRAFFAGLSGLSCFQEYGKLKGRSVPT